MESVFSRPNLLLQLSVLAILGGTHEIRAQPGARTTGSAALVVADGLSGSRFFAQVRGAAVDDSGTVYLLNTVDAVVRAVDRHGRTVAQLGGRGESDRLFEQPIRLGLRGDTLWVYDRARQRVTFWRAGRVLGHMQVSVPSALAGARSVEVLGVYRDLSLLVRVNIGSAAVLAGQVQRLTLARITSAGVVINEVGSVDVRHFLYAYESALTESRITRTQPFDDGTLVAFDPHDDSVVLVDRAVSTESQTATSVVVRTTRVSARGDTISTRPVHLPSFPLGRMLRDSAVALVVNDAMLTAPPQFGDRERARTVIERAMYLPERLTPVVDMFLGRDGALWLSLRGNGRDYLVLSHTGRVMMTARSPSGVVLWCALRNAAWGVVRGVEPGTAKLMLLKFNPT